MNFSKDWCIKMAKLEDGQEIGAGLPNHPLRADPMRDYLEHREKTLEARVAELEALASKLINYCDSALHQDQQYHDERGQLIEIYQGGSGRHGPTE